MKIHLLQPQFYFLTHIRLLSPSWVQCIDLQTLFPIFSLSYPVSSANTFSHSSIFTRSMKRGVYAVMTRFGFPVLHIEKSLY